MINRLGNSLYFFLSLRVIGVLCGVIVLFCIALTEGWPTRLPAVIGLIFSLFGLLFVSCSIASLFVWDLSAMGIAKRCLLVWVYLLSNLIAGVMFIIAPSVCNYYNQFGCFETTYSPGFKIAAAFCFIMFIFGVFDVILNFVFLFKERRDAVAPRPPSSQTDIQPHPKPPNISVIDTTADFSDPFQPRKAPSSTYV